MKKILSFEERLFENKNEILFDLDKEIDSAKRFLSEEFVKIDKMLDNREVELLEYSFDRFKQGIGNIVSSAVSGALAGAATLGTFLYLMPGSVNLAIDAAATISAKAAIICAPLGVAAVIAAGVGAAYLLHKTYKRRKALQKALKDESDPAKIVSLKKDLSKLTTEEIIQMNKIKAAKATEEAAVKYINGQKIEMPKDVSKEEKAGYEKGIAIAKKALEIADKIESLPQEEQNKAMSKYQKSAKDISKDSNELSKLAQEVKNEK